MSLTINRFKYLKRRSKRGFRGYPVATIAFYGPNDKHASKVSAGIVLKENAEPEFMKKWYSSQGEDVRREPWIAEEILEFIKTHQVVSCGMTDRIIGCPHEERIDYPENQFCPQCPFWQNKNRWSGEKIH